MCGSEGSIRIEPAENGMSIDAYMPGSGERPGAHRKLVATDAEHAMRLLKPHLVKIGKKAGRGKGKGRVALVGAVAPDAPKGRKRAGRKRA